MISWRTLADRAAADPLTVGTKILVIVTLYGGNDGLNTGIPYQDSAYHDARASFGYTLDEVLRLDDTLGLNPAMKGTAGLWSAGQLAVVRGVGYPQPDRSHFRSMDIWQTASPAAPVNTGWIGRWLDSTGDDPVRAVNIGSVLPPLAVGSKGAAAALSLGRTELPDDLAGAITGLGASDPQDTPQQVSVATSYCSERTVAATFAPVLSAGGSTDPHPDHSVPAASGGAHSNLQQQFDLVARCIKAGVPTTVYTVSLGGFDTHTDERTTQETQLGGVPGVDHQRARQRSRHRRTGCARTSTTRLPRVSPQHRARKIGRELVIDACVVRSCGNGQLRPWTTSTQSLLTRS